MFSVTALRCPPADLPTEGNARPPLLRCGRHRHARPSATAARVSVKAAAACLPPASPAKGRALPLASLGPGTPTPVRRRGPCNLRRSPPTARFCRRGHPSLTGSRPRHVRRHDRRSRGGSPCASTVASGLVDRDCPSFSALPATRSCLLCLSPARYNTKTRRKKKERDAHVDPNTLICKVRNTWI